MVRTSSSPITLLPCLTMAAQGESYDSHASSPMEGHLLPLDSSSVIAENRSDSTPSPVLMIPPRWQGLNPGAPRRISVSSPGPGALSTVAEVSDVHSPPPSDLSCRATALTSVAMNGPSSPDYVQSEFQHNPSKNASVLDLLPPRQQRTFVTSGRISPHFEISPPVYRSPTEVFDIAVDGPPFRDYVSRSEYE